jgi:hypothetical protein
MFSSLSKSSRDEILQTFASSTVSRFQKLKDLLDPERKEPVDVKQNTAFESASLTFGIPLVLPKYNNCEDGKKAVIRVGSNYPVAKASDLYSIATLPDIGRICKEIDTGLFVSNTKSVNWSKGSKFHHMDWDVKRVFMEVKCLQPATSAQIDQALPTMDRRRVTAVLRELRKQGLLIVT